MSNTRPSKLAGYEASNLFFRMAQARQPSCTFNFREVLSWNSLFDSAKKNRRRDSSAAGLNRLSDHGFFHIPRVRAGWTAWWRQYVVRQYHLATYQFQERRRPFTLGHLVYPDIDLVQWTLQYSVNACPASLESFAVRLPKCVVSSVLHFFSLDM